MKTPTLALAAALVSTALLAGCSSGSGAQKLEIEIFDNEFDGGNRNFTVGTQVEFDNEGSAVHTVTIHKVGEPATELRLDQELSSGQKADFTFAEAGTYHVWCKKHGGMTSGMAIVITIA